MKSLNNICSKFVVIVLSLILSFPSFSYAGSTKQELSKTQVAVALSPTAESKGFFSEDNAGLLISGGILAGMISGLICGKIIFSDSKANTSGNELLFAKQKVAQLEKDLEAANAKQSSNSVAEYKRGLQEGKEIGHAEGYQKGEVAGYKAGKIEGKIDGLLEKNKGKRNVIKDVHEYQAEATRLTRENVLKNKEIDGLKKEIATLQKHLETRGNIIGTQNDITKLVLKINNDITLLQNTADQQEAAKIRTAIEGSLAKLSALKAPNASTREALAKFLQETSAHLKGKGGALGLLAIGVISVSLMFVASNASAEPVVSNSRLAVARTMEATYKETPALLYTTVQQLKAQYGDAVVVGYVYENQAKYMPLLSLQSELLRDPKTLNSIKNISKLLGSSSDRNKAALLGTLADVKQ